MRNLLILRTWMIWFSGSIESRLPGKADRHHNSRSQSNSRRDRLYPNEALIGSSVAGLFPVSDRREG